VEDKTTSPPNQIDSLAILATPRTPSLDAGRAHSSGKQTEADEAHGRTDQSAAGPLDDDHRPDEPERRAK
jgi:hypothetical protein